MRGDDYIKTLPELAPLLKGADHVDVKTVSGTQSLREFVASMMNYQPGWMTFLYRVRAVFVRFLGMRQNEVPKPFKLRPEDVPMTPGAKLAIFKVRLAEEDRFIVAEVDDTHLKAALGVVVEPLGGGRKNFHVVTIVHYHKWTGPVYFNVIRPFHHVVVRGMAQAGVGPV